MRGDSDFNFTYDIQCVTFVYLRKAEKRNVLQSAFEVSDIFSIFVR